MAARAGKAREVHEPLADGAFELGRAVTSGSAVRVHGRGEEIGEHADRRRGAGDPAEEAGVAVAEPVGRDGGGQEGEDFVVAPSTLRQREGDPADGVLGQLGPDALLFSRVEKRGGRAENTVTETEKVIWPHGERA